MRRNSVDILLSLPVLPLSRPRGGTTEGSLWKAEGGRHLGPALRLRLTARHGRRQEAEELENSTDKADIMQKIMLVDDDVDIIESYRAVLEAAGYEVRSAHDGAAGFTLFTEFLPDVAVVDLAMEHFDSGFTLCKRIKDTPEGQRTPVIILTSAGHDTGYRFSTQSEEEKKWIKADHFLDKPVPPQDLLQFLHDRVLKSM